MTYNKYDMAEENKDIIWRAAEFQYFEKNPMWYVIVIATTIIVSLFALWQNNFFFAVFIVLAGVMIIFLGKKRPKVVEFRITEDGIEIGKDLEYDYETLEGFTVREYPNRLNQIIIKRDSAVNPFVKMPVDSNILPDAIEKIENHIPKKEYDESIVDTFSDLFRF